jgi:hypothetical protein
MATVEELLAVRNLGRAACARRASSPRSAHRRGRRLRSDAIRVLAGILLGLLASGQAPAAELSRLRPAAGPPAKAYRYARALIERHDRNADGKLQKDEWSPPPGLSKRRDVHADQEITVEELVRRMMVYGAQRRLQPGWLPPSSEPEPAPAEKESDEFAKEQVETPPVSPKERPADGPRTTIPSLAPEVTPRRPKRFHLPPSRIPPGLPDWFLSRDADGDGQLTLSEYASGGTATAQLEFSRFDLNGDGVLTPQEYLKVNKPAKPTKPAVKP